MEQNNTFDLCVKRILTIQDLSCVGRCSLTIALPVLSALGVETCVLPTALLSNHTAFPRWSHLDLTPEMANIMAAWRENGIRFDGFLLGYLGSGASMELARTCFQDFSKQDAKVLIDPAFGDNGKLYAGFDEGYVTAMADLIRWADILLPNLTEACLLTGTEYREDTSLEFAKEVVERLGTLTPGAIVLTGVERDGEIGELIYADRTFTEVWGTKLPHRFHGTGDLFASAFAALYLQDGDITAACAAAGRLVAVGIRATDGPGPYGVRFEYPLAHPDLWRE